MNKRTFLKMFSSLMATPIVSPVLAWALGDKLHNWAGNVEYSTERLYSANSLEQVRDFVRNRATLKVLGTRHCFNRIADSTQYYVFSFFAGMMCLQLLWVRTMVPETKGVPLEELQKQLAIG